MKALLPAVLSAVGLLAPCSWGSSLDAPPSVSGVPVYRLLPGPLPSGGDRELINKLLYDNDASVRIAAAMYLKHYANNHPEARWALIKVLHNRSEKDSLRRECAKSLSLAGHDQAASNALWRIASGAPLESDDLRSASIKSLYLMHNRHDVRVGVQNLLDRGDESLDVRRAAAWSLFMAAGKIETREALLSVMEGRDEDELRLEAVKSLFGVTNVSRIRDALLKLAQDERESTTLRYGAILSMITRRGDWNVRRALEYIEKRDSNPALRAAALHALYRDIDYTIADFFHLAFHPPGVQRDPLINE